MVLAHDISKGERTKDVKISQNITFETMLLAPDTLKGLKESGFHKPSPIQLYGIPIGKCGFDLLLEAKSGTGKTAVFSIIALEKLDFGKGLQVIILTPTREIAAQICEVLKQIGCIYQNLHIEVVMGGLPIQDDIEKFKKPVHIVVGSPGRVKHLIRDKLVDVKSVRLLVLDEADKLMESAFQSDIKYIHASLPKQKQVIMSSATYPESSRNVINTFMQNPSHICPDSDCVLLGVQQKVSFIKHNSNIIKYTQDKFKELNKVLGRLQFKQCLVFCNYQARVSEVHDKLKKAGWPSEKLHGQQEQTDRLDALKTLQQYKCRILVSTDLAARGIDASNIDLVVNFEPPYEWQTYLHRIGRAGRFGSYGLAVTILSEGKEENKFRQLLKQIELPMPMRHLWSDEEFHLKDKNVSSSSEKDNLPSDNVTCNDVTKKEMWDLLSGKSSAINSIETFESLCKSSDTQDTPKIEHFSDLLCSFENKYCPETDEFITYKHMDMGITNQSVISQNPITKKEKDTSTNDLEESSDLNISSNVNDKGDNLKETSTDASEKINDDNAYATSNKIKEKHDTNKTMLALDLPVSFSSTKFINHNMKQKINQSMPRNKTYSCNVNNSKGSSVNYMPPRSQGDAELLINGHTNYDKFYVEEQIKHKNQTKIDNYKETNNYFENKYVYNNPQKQNYSWSGNKRITPENRCKQTEKVRLYSNWYNQMKVAMKYIEQAVYIEEMSKS